MFNVIGSSLKSFIPVVSVAITLSVIAASRPTRQIHYVPSVAEQIITPIDTPPGTLPYPVKDGLDPREDGKGAIDLDDPNNISSDVEFDPATGKYTVSKKIGDRYYRYPMSFTLEEYTKYDMDRAIRDYWRSKIAADKNAADSKQQANKPLFGFAIESPSFDRIFGGNTIDIRPQGSAEVTFGVNSSRTDNPALGERQRRFTNMDFKQRMQVNVLGSVGEKLKITTNYNTEATFDFENQVKLEYTGFEDEIIKKIEFGNVSMPINSSLISGSQTLFGAKAQLQFGRLTSTTVFSSQRGKKSEIDVAGGAQTSNFEIKADEYEANKHYFLAHYFRDQYDVAMSSLPNVNSGVNITRIEVWVTNMTNATDETRNFIAFSDLGEDQIHFTDPTGLSPAPVDQQPNNALPDNGQNTLFTIMSGNPSVVGFSGATQTLQNFGYQAAVHYEKIESARKLPETAYTVNPRLGFISLNQQALNADEVLAVAFEYTLNGKTYQVGQFSTDGIAPPNALILKLLKPTITNPRIPIWDLMMKNVYSMNAFQVNRDQFLLNVFYNNPSNGVDINYLPVNGLDKTPLIQVLNSDRLDPNNQALPDGVFDFVDNASTQGGTINSANGRIFLPTVEPFGGHLRKKMQEAQVAQNIIDQIVYQELYDSTKIAAIQKPELNRFKLKGSFKSASGSEIMLNAINIPQGSVSVTAGGVRLVENTDYTVDYNLGRVKIINQGLLESQTPIKVSLESNSLFSVQQKTFIGQRFDYRVNKDFNLGATVINLSERPITPKVNFNEEPINNTMFGFDGNYSTEAPALTRMIDRLPFIETKEPSSINISGEYARLVPGHSKAIGEAGNSYLDDFEGSQSTIDLRAVNAWQMASVPQGQPNLFPEASLSNDLRYGFNRARMAWYVVDQSVFFQNTNLKPANVNNDMLSDHRMRQILEQEVFPNRQLPQGTPANIAVFDLAFYPTERGPYNFNPSLTPEGRLTMPTNSWAGITRRLTTTDFEANNIEFIQFWIMDPFNEDSENKTGGSLYINLGNVSEDALKDGRKSFENGLPKDVNDSETQLDSTAWGLVPRKQSIVNAFANVNGSTKIQDVGYDGLNTDQERAFFADYVNSLAGLNPEALAAIQQDPANDNYHYYRGTDYDAQSLNILQRYKRYNDAEGNSPSQSDSPESYVTSGSNIPNNEDLNLDNNLSEAESYFQYRIELKPGEMEVGKNFITSIVEATPELRNGKLKPVKWYQFKIPVRSPQQTIGGLQDYRSIRFMRMFMRDFNEPVVLRFARMEFIRGEWRKYDLSLADPGPAGTNTAFDVGAVNLEENAQRNPINYVLPPDINREVDYTTANQRQLNEQSLSLRVCNLEDGDAKAAFRNVGFDMRSYKKIKMFAHAEAADPNLAEVINYGEVSVFVRLGTDFDNNYYEYELPMTITDRSSGTKDPALIWPQANYIEIDFDKLTAVKLRRNNQNTPVNLPYKELIDNTRITVKGNPVLNDVRTIMIGVRNPNSGDNPWAAADNGRDICAEVWVNELRLTDFDEFGGWAGLVRMNAKLADLGALNIAGNISTPGFGSVEKRLSERQRETKKGIDATTNLELGKFFPEKSGLKIPVYLGFSEQVVNPMFDPLTPDVQFSETSRNLTASERRNRLRTSQTLTKRRSINFTNIHKERGENQTEMHWWDIENFGFTYAYSENFFRDINTQYRFNKSYRGGITYGFQNKPKAFTPFKNNEYISKSKYLKPIADFNLNLGPKQLGFRTNIDRNYTEQQIRNNIPFALDPTPTYTKTFNWQRGYDLKYDITNALSFDFSANNTAYIKETPGRVNKDDKEAYEMFKDTVWSNIRNLGQTTNYGHNSNLTYKLPFKKLPFTDWLDGSATYGSSYQWDRAPFSQDTLGNTIQNSATQNWDFSANMATLYNKIPFFKEIINKKNKAQAQNRVNNKPTTPGAPQLPDSLKSKKTKPTSFTFLEQVGSLLMMTKNASINFKRSAGTLLPGFKQRSRFIGMDDAFDAPGLDFVFGRQRDDYFDFAADQGWLVQQTALYQPATLTRTRGTSYRLSLEPVKSLRIDLTGNKDYSESTTGFFRFNDSIADWEYQSPVNRGTVTVSIISIQTLFQRDDKKNFNNPVFDNLLANTFEISKRQAADNGISDLIDSTGYYDGYNKTNQDVMIPAFLAAYTGKNASKQRLNPFNQASLPNWRINYDGLSKIPALQKYFRTVTLSHSYRSTYNTSFVTNLQATENGERKRTGSNRDFVPSQQVSTVTINESLSPLIKLDATLKNSLNAQIEINKDRQISLSMTNLQITEIKGTEFKIGAGYRFKDVKFPFKIGNKDIKSDLNVNISLALRNNTSIIRKAIEEINDATSGRRIIAIKFNADYNVNQRITLRAYYDRTVTKPVLSIPFPNYVTNGGITIRMILAS
ncbi:MAG TPA: cell surface protein SprA [Luteibaculaceae bacterium]|nr:cell surface protein SprA [Luteibaculaceae bacterium]